MSTILDQILAVKKREVAAQKMERSMADWEKEPLFGREIFSLKKSLQDETKTGIIAEFKRASPSKGILNDTVLVSEVTKGYADNGASGLSVLTDAPFFQGSLSDLEEARANAVPVLRKDFTIDAYQVIEAKGCGADVILLIAACLTRQEVKELTTIAKSIGLEVLLELHGEDELDHICPEVDLVGINNRNLKTFEVNLEHSVRLSQKIGNDFIKVAESGISDVKNIAYLKDFGFQGFLIGENFMKEKDPVQAFVRFAQKLMEGKHEV